MMENKSMATNLSGKVLTAWGQNGIAVWLRRHDILAHAALFVVMFVVLLPILWLVSSLLKDAQQFYDILLNCCPGPSAWRTTLYVHGHSTVAYLYEKQLYPGLWGHGDSGTVRFSGWLCFCPHVVPGP